MQVFQWRLQLGQGIVRSLGLSSQGLLVRGLLLLTWRTCEPDLWRILEVKSYTFGSVALCGVPTQGLCIWIARKAHARYDVTCQHTELDPKRVMVAG